jgi:hypothetical protein
MKPKNLQKYLNEVAELGCIVTDCSSPACLHHPRFASGAGQRSPDWLVIPLCREHHQGEYSIHGSPALFYKIEGTEQELLARTIEMLWERR